MAELPPDYGLVLGRVGVSVDGNPVHCAEALGEGGCRVTLLYRNTQALALPLRSTVDLWPTRRPDPFFVIRLPQGEYEVSRFEGGGSAVPPRFQRGVRLGPTFEVGAGEALYVGSLFIDFPGRRGSAKIEVVDQSADARQAAEELEPDLGSKLVTRLMR